MRPTSGPKKLPSRDFKQSFQVRSGAPQITQPITGTTQPQKRLKIFSGTSKQTKNIGSQVPKLPDDRLLKSKLDFIKNPWPKNASSLLCNNKENICPNSQKSRSKVIESEDLLQPTDENVFDKSNSVINHRFSDIYKPSKFLEQNKSKLSLGTTQAISIAEHAAKTSTTNDIDRRRSLLQGTKNIIMNCVTLPDYGSMKYTYTEEECEDEPIYMLTEGYDSLLRDKEHDELCKMLQRTEWEEEKKWSFQQPYKLQKSYVERKEGDNGDLSEVMSSSKKTASSSMKKGYGLITCDSVNQESKRSTLFNGDTSERKYAVKDLTKVLSPFQKGSGSKLDSSLALTMSSTSEGIAYRSAFLNMANVNTKKSFPKLMANYKDSFIDYKARVLEQSKESSLQNKIMTRDNKNNGREKITNNSNIQNAKSKEFEKRKNPPLIDTFVKNERRESKSKATGLLKAYNKQELNVQNDCLFMECEETLTNPSNLDQPSSNKLINTLFTNSLTFYCEESLDPPSAFGAKDTFNEDQIKVISKKLSFKAKAELNKESFKCMGAEEALELWKKEICSNDISDEIYESMLHNEGSGILNAYYLDKQTEINWLMRAILIDWMIEVAEEFGMKRTTLYSSVSYVDRYLSSVPTVNKSQLQLIGTTALLVAYKMEETECIRIKNFSKATDDAYTVDQLKEMELQMCNVLKWKLNYNNLFIWTNWYMQKWDQFLQQTLLSKTSSVIKQFNKSHIFFKQANEESYNLYREVIQIVDLLLLDIETLQYNQRAIVASAIYLMTGKHYHQFELSTIVHEFSQSSTFLSTEFQEFNDVFSVYLKGCFGFELEDLYASVQYVAPYFAVKISYEMPYTMKRQGLTGITGHSEEFFCYQTHSPENLPMIKEIARSKI